MESITDLQTTIRTKLKGSPNGISAAFIPINEKWAIKLFKSQSQRDEVKETQAIFANCGYGPEVGEDINLPEKIDKYKFGYFTEIVKTCVPGINRDYHTDEEHEERMDAWAEFEEEYGSECDEGTEVFNALRDAFDATGMELTDMHAGNLGWKDGKIIPIDFGCD